MSLKRPNTKPRLSLALDFADRSSCLKAVETLADQDLVFKFGLRVLPLMKATDFESLRDSGVCFFIDAKLHDIPTQVAGAVRTWSELGASFLTLHLGGGTAMLSQAAAAEGAGLCLLGVSVLTSLSDQDLAELGWAEGSSRLVERWAGLARRAGLNSFVCSVAEAQALRQSEADTFLCTPGLHLEGEAPAADQRRSFTVREAVQAGSQLLVLGRSILGAADLRARVRQVQEQMEG